MDEAAFAGHMCQRETRNGKLRAQADYGFKKLWEGDVDDGVVYNMDYRLSKRWKGFYVPTFV